MALDFSSDVNQSFLEDNFLSSEDWGFQSDFIDKDVPSDVTSLESFGITLNCHQYGTTQDDISSNSSTKSWNGMDDDFISTVDADVKGEPSSPQLSQCSTDSHSSQHLQNDQYLVKLESPPLTPPHEVCTPVVSTDRNGITQDNQDQLNQLNLLDGSVQLPTTQTHNGYVLQNNHSVPNEVQVVNGNMSKGSRVVNGNINLVPTSSGVLVRNGKCVPKVVMTTNGLPNGIKVQVVNNGIKRLANGTIKSGGRSSTKKGPMPKRDANGVTIHPPIIPKMEGIQVNGVPATIAVTQMTAAKAIMFSQNGNAGCDLTTSCQGTVPLQQTVTVSAANQGLSPQAPEDITDEKEMMAWKRQQRMIKNRESASLSRKKKKEYVQTLELKMQNITMENDMLKDENMSLKKRLCALEEEVERLKCLSSTSPSSPMSGKYVTCLLAVILFIGINLTPFSLLTINTRNDDFTVTSHHGRSLLSFEDDFQNGSDVQSPPALMADIIKDQYYNETLLRLHDESSQHLMRLAELEQALLMQQALNCSFLHKQSESAVNARLLDVLRKLAPDKEQTNKDNRNPKEEKSTHSKKLKKLRKSRRKKMKVQEAKWSQMESDERSLQIYDSFFIRHYENLINSLERRDDTYYIVSLTRDHLLLPAMSHNSTQRPKMSLVMPAGGNATLWDTPKDHMTMMQIDCEVTNTRTISVPDFRNAVTQNDTKTSTPPHHTHKDGASSNHSSPPAAASQTSGSFKAIPPPHRKSLPPHIKKFRAGKKYSLENNVTKT